MALFSVLRLTFRLLNKLNCLVIRYIFKRVTYALACNFKITKKNYMIGSRMTYVYRDYQTSHRRGRIRRFSVFIDVCLRQKKTLGGHSNNTWHFFGIFLTLPPSPLPCDIFFSKITVLGCFRLWTVKWIFVSFKAWSCSWTWLFPSEKYLNQSLKEQKTSWDPFSDTPRPPSPSLECYVLFERPFTLSW